MWDGATREGPHTGEGNMVATAEQILLRPEEIISLWSGVHLATSTTGTEEGKLLVGSLCAILLRKVGGLQDMARLNGGQLLEFELVNTGGGEREEQERRERREEHGGAGVAAAQSQTVL